MAAKSKCHVCTQRKGKRVCPARSAPICPRCCAQSRVVEIDCPVDCSFLGAEGSMLLAARQGGDAPLASGDDITAFVSELVESGPRGRFMDDAEPTAINALNQLIEFVDAEDEDATLQGAIWEWLVYGALDVKEKPLVDRIVSRLPRPLTEAERSALRGLHDSRYGLFVITAFPAADRVAVRDVLSDQTLELHHEAMAERHKVGQCLGCFVTRTQSGLEVVSGAWQLPEGAEDRFPLRLREIQDESPLKEIPLPEFLTRLAIVVPLLMFEHFGEQESGAGEPGFPPSDF